MNPPPAPSGGRNGVGMGYYGTPVPQAEEQAQYYAPPKESHVPNVPAGVASNLTYKAVAQDSISTLVNVARRYGATPPSYFFKKVGGKAHCPVFECTVRWDGDYMQEIAQAGIKMEAKRNAALKMINRLSAMGIEINPDVKKNASKSFIIPVQQSGYRQQYQGQGNPSYYTHSQGQHPSFYTDRVPRNASQHQYQRGLNFAGRSGGANAIMRPSNINADPYATDSYSDLPQTGGYAHGNGHQRHSYDQNEINSRSNQLDNSRPLYRPNVDPMKRKAIFGGAPTPTLSPKTAAHPSNGNDDRIPKKKVTFAEHTLQTHQQNLYKAAVFGPVSTSTPKNTNYTAEPNKDRSTTPSTTHPRVRSSAVSPTPDRSKSATRLVPTQYSAPDITITPALNASSVMNKARSSSDGSGSAKKPVAVAKSQNAKPPTATPYASKPNTATISGANLVPVAPAPSPAKDKTAIKSALPVPVVRAAPKSSLTVSPNTNVATINSGASDTAMKTTTGDKMATSISPAKEGPLLGETTANTAHVQPAVPKKKAPHVENAPLKARNVPRKNPKFLRPQVTPKAKVNNIAVLMKSTKESSPLKINASNNANILPMKDVETSRKESAALKVKKDTESKGDSRMKDVEDSRGLVKPTVTEVPVIEKDTAIATKLRPWNITPPPRRSSRRITSPKTLAREHVPRNFNGIALPINNPKESSMGSAPLKIQASNANNAPMNDVEACRKETAVLEANRNINSMRDHNVKDVEDSRGLVNPTVTGVPVIEKETNLAKQMRQTGITPPPRRSLNPKFLQPQVAPKAKVNNIAVPMKSTKESSTNSAPLKINASNDDHVPMNDVEDSRGAVNLTASEVPLIEKETALTTKIRPWEITPPPRRISRNQTPPKSLTAQEAKGMEDVQKRRTRSTKENKESSAEAIAANVNVNNTNTATPKVARVEKVRKKAENLGNMTNKRNPRQSEVLLDGCSAEKKDMDNKMVTMSELLGTTSHVAKEPTAPKSMISRSVLPAKKRHRSNQMKLWVYSNGDDLSVYRQLRIATWNVEPFMNISVHVYGTSGRAPTPNISEAARRSVTHEMEHDLRKNAIDSLVSRRAADTAAKLKELRKDGSRGNMDYELSRVLIVSSCDSNIAATEGAQLVKADVIDTTIKEIADEFRKKYNMVSPSGLPAKKRHRSYH